MPEYEREYVYPCVYEGVVFDNLDPLLIGRVKVTIPGLIEPSSGWALPYATPGGGSDARGFWFVPTIGSNVAVVFKDGDIEHPRYFVGAWSAPGQTPESPTFVRQMQPSEAVQVAGIQTRKWNIVLDDREGNDRLTIESREFPDNSITIDGKAQAVQINGTVAVQIVSMGMVNISALSVVINGRPVLPTGGPI